MAKVLPVLLVIATAVLARLAWPTLRARMPDDFQKLSGTERVALARTHSEPRLRAKYRAAGVPYPGAIFLRWLKRDAELELWSRAGGEAFRRIETYPILQSSGKPGPKRREGDKQVPEGFYEIDRFNPESAFHLSLGLNYPNASDRVLSDAQRPGGDIFIHGKDVSIGCAPVGDAAIEELYLAAFDARAGGQERIAVHIFTARMSGPEWTRFAESEFVRRPELRAFWAQLLPVYEAFEKHRRVPDIEIARDGRYLLKTP